MTQVTPIRDLKGYLEALEVERIIATATNPRDALLVRIPWRSGIRVSELISIRIQDIDFDNRAIVIKVLKQRKRDGKTVERRRVVPIDQGTLAMVTEYLEWRKQFPYKGDLLFPISRQRVDQIYWKLGKKSRHNKSRRPSSFQTYKTASVCASPHFCDPLCQTRHDHRETAKNSRALKPHND